MAIPEPDTAARSPATDSQPAPPVGESERARKALLGQFLTPQWVAEFMASLFESAWPEVRLLDAGAGSGTLTAALVERLLGAATRPSRVEVTAYEIDTSLLHLLSDTLERCSDACRAAGVEFSAAVLNEDFVAATVPAVRLDLFSPRQPEFNAAIVNPPYRKIQSDSPTRRLLHSAGIETSNLYSAFVALISRLLVPGGELVAITPRSFCNGPYFKTFRTAFLDEMALSRLHVFSSRAEAFAGDRVLQENVVVHARKGTPRPAYVTVSTSSGKPGGPVSIRSVAYEEIVASNDPHQFIHLPSDEKHHRARTEMAGLIAGLEEIGIEVSTGRVVDFRAKAFLRRKPDIDTVPLIYPCHFNGPVVRWPKLDARKPNAIVKGEATQSLLIPEGVYVLVKRFSAKEERRRVVASLLDPEIVPAPLVGIENHLNYFHADGRGLPRDLARGLAAFLNSTLVDVFFRRFSGHTQVNATDLRSLRYPSGESLTRLGRDVAGAVLTQADLDARVEAALR